MGSEVFQTKAKGKTAGEAFRAAVEAALYEYGHRGYSGTIAEKKEFVMIDLPEDMNAIERERHAETLLEDIDDRIGDKWGPAGCIKLDDDQWLFFGWASS